MTTHNMKYKIVFSDVDGTMIDSRQRMQLGTRTAIDLLQASGIPFALSRSLRKMTSLAR